MATLTSYGTTTNSTPLAWTNQNNALYSPGSFASLTTTNVNTFSIIVVNLGLQGLLPSNAVIDRVLVTIPNYVSQTNRWSSISVIPVIGSTAISGVSPASLTVSSNTANVETATFTGLTATDLLNSNFGIFYSILKNGTQSATANVDFMRVDVDYRSESWQEVKL